MAESISRKRYDCLDLLKFVLSLLICILHTICERGGVNWLIPITRCAVPIFFTISGYLFFSKYCKNPSIKRTYIPFCKRNVVLYMIWLIILLPITDTSAWFRGGLIKGIILFPFRLVIGNTFDASWFLSALVVGTGVIILIDRVMNTKMQILLSGIIYLVCVLTCNYRLLFPEDSLFIRLFVYMYPGTMARSFPVALLPIALGKYISENGGGN